jgi:hypothetical protein
VPPEQEPVRVSLPEQVRELARAQELAGESGPVLLALAPPGVSPGGLAPGVLAPALGVPAEQAAGESGSPLTGAVWSEPREAYSRPRTTRPSPEPEKPRQTRRK